MMGGVSMKVSQAKAQQQGGKGNLRPHTTPPAPKGERRKLSGYNKPQ